MPEPLTMSAEREASLRATLPRSIFSMAVFAEIDALRGRVAELERERDRLRAPRYQHARKMWIAESLMDDALTMRTADGRFLLTFQMGEPDEDGFYTPLITSHEDDAFKALTDERAALRSEVERLRPWARFGARAFEDFWHDAEPGDLEGGDLQEMARDCGLLGRTAEVGAGATHAEGCDWQPGMDVDDCDCWSPMLAPLPAPWSAQEDTTDAT